MLILQNSYIFQFQLKGSPIESNIVIIQFKSV